MVFAANCLTVDAAASDTPYAGRRLTEVLDALQSAHLRLVYNSAIVPDDLRVLAEPVATDPMQRLQQLLEPLGLRARRVSGDIHAIVRAPRGAVPSQARDAVQPQAMRPATLEEIVVAASRFHLAEDTADRHTFFTQAELEGLPRLADDSLKALHRLPGAASNGISGLAHLRGGEQNETLVVLDGLPLYEPFHLKNFLGPTSVLDPRILGSLDVMAGGYTAEFGDRMSAIVDARSVHPDDSRQYELGLSLFHADAFAAHRFAGDRAAWLVSLRRSNLDEIVDLTDATIGEPSYFDAFTRVDYQWSAATRASLHLLLARDDIVLTDEDVGESVEATYRNTYLWGTLEHDWSQGLRGRVIASYTGVENIREGSVDDPGRRVGTVEDRRHYDIAGLKADFSIERTGWLHRAGVEMRSLVAEYDYRSQVNFAAGYPFPDSPGSTRETQLAPEPSGEQYSAYFTSRMRLAERWTAELGLRWDEQSYDTAEADDQLAPRVNVLYAASDATRLRASWGRYQQFQAINELQVEDGVADFQPAQRADHTILGIEHDWSAGTSMRLEAYRKDYGSPRVRYENAFDPLTLLPELDADRVRLAPGSSLAEGVELMLAWRGAEDWNAWASYAWSRVRDRIGGEDVPRSWDQTHGVGFGLRWASGPWDAAGVIAYHTGWPTTNLRLADDATGDASPVIEVGVRNRERFADYATLDLRVSRVFALRRGALSVFGELTNALDRTNECCVTFAVDQADGRWMLEREVDGWLPLVPSIGVRWSY